jgi:phage shock protein C
MEHNRLYRSRKNRVIAGICGGLGEHFNIDPVIVRVVLVLLALTPVNGILLYIVLWIIIPEAPVEQSSTTPKPPARKATKQEEE